VGGWEQNMVMRIAMRERRDAQAKGLSESADDRRV
jgi:hypothetical protein